jgi:5'-deoxynucleotidase YfbR-like HD superfamily hydrolase
MKKNEKVVKALRMREAGKIERCHVIPHVTPYNVGFHSWAMLTLLDLLHPRPTLALYRAIMKHDLAERHTGDMPGIVRVVDPELYATYAAAGEMIDEHLGYTVKLNENEKKWLKALDKLEFWMYCHDEANMGNDNIQNGIDATEAWFNRNWSDLPPAVQRFFRKFEWERTSEMISEEE